MMDRKAVKAEAKGILGRARMSPYVTTLLVLGTGFLLSRLTDWVQGGSPLYSYELQARYYDALTGGDPAALERLLYALPEDTGAGFFCSVLVSLVMLTLYGGYYLYCMGVRRGAVMPYATLADGLGAAGRLIWCGVQMAVKIFLWSLLLGIPGIIAAYRYRFAYYNILTDDNITAGVLPADQGAEMGAVPAGPQLFGVGGPGAVYLRPAPYLADALYDAVRSGVL